MDQNTKNVLTFAKIVTDSGGMNDCGVDRDAYDREIRKLAADTRGPHETIEQAYTRVITESEAGRLLYKAYKAAPKAPVQAAQDVEPEPDGDATRELRQMAAAMANEMGISAAQATSRLMSDPRRQDLVRRVLEEERSATRAVREQRKPIRLAQEANERDWRLGRSPGSARM